MAAHQPRKHDRFVLIGLCWLYGRSEFPPPPPPPQQLPSSSGTKIKKHKQEPRSSAGCQQACCLRVEDLLKTRLSNAPGTHSSAAHLAVQIKLMTRHMLCKGSRGCVTEHRASDRINLPSCRTCKKWAGQQSPRLSFRAIRSALILRQQPCPCPDLRAVRYAPNAPKTSFRQP